MRCPFVILGSWRTRREISKLSRCGHFQCIPSPGHQLTKCKAALDMATELAIPSNWIPKFQVNPKFQVWLWIQRAPTTRPSHLRSFVSTQLLALNPFLLEISRMSSVSHIKHLLIRVFSLVPEQPKMMRLKSWMHLGLVFFFQGEFNRRKGRKGSVDSISPVMARSWHNHR